MTLPQVPLPPYARLLDVRATRAAFAAGTLGTVRNDARGDDEQRRVELPHSNRYDADNVEHDTRTLSTAGDGDQHGCESVLHGSYSRSVRASADADSEAAEARRLAFLRRAQSTALLHPGTLGRSATAGRRHRRWDGRA